MAELAINVGTTRAARPERAIAVWLLICCAMVFVMVVLGGLTRLTGSGLSMVEWHPVYGILPPLGDAQWQALFEKYQATPEFRTVNFWMSLADFKSIFWLEYVHRVWGRLIGLVFIAPFLWFLWRGRIGRPLGWKLGAIFLLGGAQGLLGWFMVMSGLVDRPEVSQYRLAAHLSLAVALYLAMLWIALGLLSPRAAKGRRLSGHAALVFGWALATMVTGAFVAGIDAGLSYNTFPLMDGRLVPELLLALNPWPINFFENPAAVQFTHRVMAECLVLLVLVLWVRGVTGEAKSPLALHLLALAALTQAGLGISTLLLQVPVALAALHQAGALVVVSLALWTVHALRRARAQGRRRRSPPPARRRRSEAACRTSP